jgi:hypothetical protein
MSLVAPRFPGYRFSNHGVAGYSLYQAVLRLEELYEVRTPPRIVVVGIADHLEERNTASQAWRAALFVYGSRGHARLPYVRMVGNTLEEFSPEGQIPPGSCRLSVMLCSHYYEWFVPHSPRIDAAESENRVVTEYLIHRLENWVEERSSRLVIVLMDKRVGSYVPFLESASIAFLSVPEWRPLAFDRHPDQQFHRDAATRLTRTLSSLLGETATEHAM